MKPQAAVLLAPLLALSQTGSATADITTYNDASSFAQATTPGSFINTFAAVQSPRSLSYNQGGFNYTVTSTGNLYGIPQGLSTFDSGAPITFSFQGSQPTAVGGNFWLTDVNNNPVQGTLQVLVNDSLFTLTDPTPSTFLGITSTQPIRTLVVLPPQEAPAVHLDYVALGPLAVAQSTLANAVSTPEPTSLVSAVLGLLALGATGRRRRCAAPPG